MKKIVFLSFLFFSVFSAFSSEAQDSTKTYVRRPKIGVTFAGGGAKGAAHIGVLKVLEEVGIPVDYVSGTSMGSIIGGLYALGYSAEQMDTIISSLNWNVYLSDKVKSRDSDKRISDNQGKYLLSLPFSFKKSGSTVKDHVTEYSDARKERRKYRDEEPSGSGKSFLKSLPGGFANGNNVLNLFNDLSVGYQDSMDFNDLPIPFACVASDLVSGQRAVLRHGKLAEAIRASMAIPGVFAPVRYDGMVLVDGGLHDNFPVDVCQDMGADIIIGIEVSKDRDVEADEISSLPELITRLLDIATQHGLEENKKRCTIYFRPDIKEFNTMSFDKESIRTIIERGYKAADEKRALLIALREELDRLGAPAHTIRNGETALNMSAISENKIKVGDVSFEGVKPREAKWMANKFKLNGGDSLSGVRLNQLLDRCYGTGAFKTLTHYLSRNLDGTYDLKVRAIPAEPHVLGMGLRVDTQEAVALLLRFGLNQNTLSGLKFDLSARFSYNPRVNITMAYAPMKLGVFYTNLGLGFEHTNLFVTTNLESAAHATFSRYNVEVFASQFHSRFIDVNAGFKLDYFDYSSVLYSDDLADNGSNANHNKYDLLALGLFARFKFDNLDRQYCAERGIKFKFFGDWRMKAAGVNSDIGTFQLNFESYIPVVRDRFVIIPQFYGRMFIGHGYETENKYFSLANFVGGMEAGRYYEQQMPFVGLNNPECMPSVAAIFRGDFRVRVYGQHYLTGIFNYCRASEGIQKVFNYSTGYDWFGGAVKYTYNTLFGPLSLDVHYSNAKDIVEGLTFSGSWGVYISMGYYF